MHGLINRALECFVRDTYGALAWAEIVGSSNLGHDSFEAMLNYDDATTKSLVSAAEAVLGKGRDALLEDLGTYLLSNPRYEPLRRLLRFGGDSFVEFLLSLEELPDRARLAISDIELPELVVTPLGPDRFELSCAQDCLGFGSILSGTIRAMADDYGALVTIDQKGPDAENRMAITIAVHESRFSEGRSFELAQILR